MLMLAKSEQPVVPAQFDTNPWLLNVWNGTLDLETGLLREHRRDGLITKLAPVNYDPQASCPLWLKFLCRIMGGNQGLIDYLQRGIGYALTGDTSERALFLLLGSGANGKTTLLETIRAMLGDYGQQASFDTFLVRQSDGPRNDLAALAGARFVAASELREGRQLDEALVKLLTGREAIRCRFLHHEFFEYRPAFKVFLAANHKPVIHGTDHAIWDRVRVIPFAVRIPEQERDPYLLERLREELSGILNWALQGCLAWHRTRLADPDEVRFAVADYREESDPIGAFLAECCQVVPNACEPVAAIQHAYNAWAQSNGEPQLSRNAFGRRLTERGFERSRGTDGVWHVRGLQLVRHNALANGMLTNALNIPTVDL
jgi:putative DNA primase/helicase